ncbi:MAG: hypothetical protein ACOC4M_08690 [Promethearchaeia archaeon]
MFRKDKAFYENLADDVEILTKPDTCSICFQKTDETLIRCPNCQTKAHMSCWANWAKTTNIGMPHLFRCHNCFNLLRFNEQYMEIVQKGKEPPAEIKFKARDITTYLREQEEKEEPQIVSVEDPLAMSDMEMPSEEVSKEKPTGFESDPTSIRPIPQSRGRQDRDEDRFKMVICPVCSAINTSNDRECHNCGNPLEKN